MISAFDAVAFTSAHHETDVSKSCREAKLPPQSDEPAQRMRTSTPALLDVSKVRKKDALVSVLGHRLVNVWRFSNVS